MLTTMNGRLNELASGGQIPASLLCMSTSQCFAFAASKDSSKTTAAQNPCFGKAIGAEAQSESYEPTTISVRSQAHMVDRSIAIDDDM